MPAALYALLRRSKSHLSPRSIARRTSIRKEAPSGVPWQFEVVGAPHVCGENPRCASHSTHLDQARR